MLQPIPHFQQPDPSPRYSLDQVLAQHNPILYSKNPTRRTVLKGSAAAILASGPLAGMAAAHTTNEPGHPPSISRSAPGSQLFRMLRGLRIPKSPRQQALALPTSGYPATNRWSVQLGEHPVAGGLGGHSFLNVVNPQGEVVFQLHGYQVDRTTGRIDHGAHGKPLQLMPFAYLGNQITTSGTVLHPPIPLTNQRNMPAMLDELMRAADRMYERNFEYFPVRLGGEAQNSNSVTNTFARIMARYAPGISNDNSITYYNTPGEDRDLVTGRRLLPREPREIIPVNRIQGPRFTHRGFDQWRSQFGRLRRVAEVRHRYPPGVDPYNPGTFDPRTRPRPDDTRMVSAPMNVPNFTTMHVLPASGPRIA